MWILGTEYKELDKETMGKLLDQIDNAGPNDLKQIAYAMAGELANHMKPAPVEDDTGALFTVKKSEFVDYMFQDSEDIEAQASNICEALKDTGVFTIQMLKDSVGEVNAHITEEYKADPDAFEKIHGEYPSMAGDEFKLI